MASNKKKKAAIRKAQTERKNGVDITKLRRSWTDERDKLLADLAQVKKELASMRSAYISNAKTSADQERVLLAERKLRTDIQNGAIAAKESLAQIRELHQAESLLGWCEECYSDWPCPTLLAIREPEQAVIAALQILELELSNPEVRPHGG